MSTDRIDVGDTVDVWFTPDESCGLGEATVLYVPCSAGESWILKGKTGGLHYVQMFSHIVRYAKP